MRCMTLPVTITTLALFTLTATASATEPSLKEIMQALRDNLLEITNGLLIDDVSDAAAKVDSLIYYSYITLLTIGYGEIYPVTSVAQKAAILVGLMGQFYLVIITAVVVEKYIRHSQNTKT